MIPNTFVNDLLLRFDIVELIGQYLSLKKQGANFISLCPFHKEKTASFTVSPIKQVYHCFGCGAHGNAISFLMQYLGQSFQDAVQDLAHRQGVFVPSQEAKGVIVDRNTSNVKKHGLKFVHKQVNDQDNALVSNFSIEQSLAMAMKFYQIQLRQSEEAIVFLKKRGISGEIAGRFKLGYAPNDWHNLLLVFDDYGAQSLLDAGLVVQPHMEKEYSDHKNHAVLPSIVQDKLISKRYDRFRNRIIFPILNSRGQVVAFGGRAINDTVPKYLNSPETLVFTKGKEIYGLFEARCSIKDKGFVIVVEGYLDVLKLVQVGCENVVAVLGTACTAEHVQKLVRHTDRIIFCFDGDDAGHKAANRTMSVILPFAIDTREFDFIFLPDGHDPDSFIEQKGVTCFHQEIMHAMPLSNFLIQNVMANTDVNKPEGRASAISRAKTLLQNLPAQALRMQIIHMLAKKLHIPEFEIVSFFELTRKRVNRKRNVCADRQKALVHGIEYRALCIMLTFPHFVLDLHENDRETLLFCTEHPELFEEVILQVSKIGSLVTFRSLVDSLRKSDYGMIFEKYFVDLLAVPENLRDFFSDDECHGSKKAFNDLEKSSRIEFNSALARLRYDACCKKLRQLSEEKKMTKEQLCEFEKLSKTFLSLKKTLPDSMAT